MAKQTEAKVSKHDAEYLTELIGMIDGQVLGDVGDLLATLKKDHKAKDTAKDGWFMIKIAGIEARSAVNHREALKNWCNAARRAIR